MTVPDTLTNSTYYMTMDNRGKTPAEDIKIVIKYYDEYLLGIEEEGKVLFKDSTIFKYTLAPNDNIRMPILTDTHGVKLNDKLVLRIEVSYKSILGGSGLIRRDFKYIDDKWDVLGHKSIYNMISFK